MDRTYVQQRIEEIKQAIHNLELNLAANQGALMVLEELLQRMGEDGNGDERAVDAADAGADGGDPQGVGRSAG